MRVIIIAGGDGTRLRPYTTYNANSNTAGSIGREVLVLEIIILQLRDIVFPLIKLAMNHLSHSITAYFGDGSRLGVCINYSARRRLAQHFGH